MAARKKLEEDRLHAIMDGSQFQNWFYVAKLVAFGISARSEFNLLWGRLPIVYVWCIRIPVVKCMGYKDFVKNVRSLREQGEGHT
jgi:hypothetical protein